MSRDDENEQLRELGAQRIAELESQLQQERARRLRLEAGLARARETLRGGSRADDWKKQARRALHEAGITKRSRPAEKIAEIYMNLMSDNGLKSLVEFDMPALYQLIAEMSEEAIDREPGDPPERRGEAAWAVIRKQLRLRKQTPMGAEDALEHVAHWTAKTLRGAWEMLYRERKRRLDAGLPGYVLPPRPETPNVALQDYELVDGEAIPVD